jgi:hypothetical protein
VTSWTCTPSNWIERVAGKFMAKTADGGPQTAVNSVKIQRPSAV